MYLIILFISAVRTVSRGHQLVAEGWALFEKTCSEVGAGELPQLLRYVKQATTPTPTPGTPITKRNRNRRMRQWRWRSQPFESEAYPGEAYPCNRGGENSLLQVPQLRHHPQEVQMGYGFPYPCCPHKEGSRVLLLSLQHLQHGFAPEA